MADSMMESSSPTVTLQSTSGQSSSSVTIGQIIPVLTADIRIENSPSSSASNQNHSSHQTLPMLLSAASPSSISTIQSVISSPIQTQSQPSVSQPIELNQSTSSMMLDSGEPEAKRKRIDPVHMLSGANDKLELRLGGILCCAVCLDLPRTAMYQVSAN